MRSAHGPASERTRNREASTRSLIPPCRRLNTLGKPFQWAGGGGLYYQSLRRPPPAPSENRPLSPSEITPGVSSMQIAKSRHTLRINSGSWRRAAKEDPRDREIEMSLGILLNLLSGIPRTSCSIISVNARSSWRRRGFSHFEMGVANCKNSGNAT